MFHFHFSILATYAVHFFFSFFIFFFITVLAYAVSVCFWSQVVRLSHLYFYVLGICFWFQKLIAVCLLIIILDVVAHFFCFYHHPYMFFSLQLPSTFTINQLMFIIIVIFPVVPCLSSLKCLGAAINNWCCLFFSS